MVIGLLRNTPGRPRCFSAPWGENGVWGVLEDRSKRRFRGGLSYGRQPDGHVRFRPDPVLQGDRRGIQRHGLRRAAVDAVAAAGAGLADYIVNLLGGADDGVGGTDLEAAAAAGADLLGNLGDFRAVIFHGG